MLSNSSVNREFISWVSERMQSYLVNTLGYSKGDILLPPITILGSGNLPQVVVDAYTESATVLNDTYFGDRYLSIDDDRPMQCFMYAFLLSSECLAINVDTLDRNLFTMSRGILGSLIDNGLLASVDGKSDVELKAYKMIKGIPENKKVYECLKTGKGVYAYRLDRAYHIGEDMRMHYVPVAPRTCIDLDREVIIPYTVYTDLETYVMTNLKDNVIAFKAGNRVTIATFNVEVLTAVFGKERVKELAVKCKRYNNGNRFEFYAPNLLASMYSDGTNKYTLETITDSQFLTGTEIKMLINGGSIQIFGKQFDLSLKDVDVRGSKNYLKDKLNYEELDEGKKAIVDSYTDTEAYRYLKSKGNKNIATYSSKLKLPRTGREVELPMETEQMRKLLREGIFEIEYLTRKGNRRLICTTNEYIVEKVYGEDFRIQAYSELIRIRSVYDNIKYFIESKNVDKAKKFIFSDMERKYGIPFEVLKVKRPLSEQDVNVEAVYNKFKNAMEGDVAPKQNSKLIIVTSLSDRKPKEGVRGNLIRSFYLDSVRSIKLLATADDILK